MNRIFRRFFRDLVKLIASSNNELAGILEQDMSNIQGKGIGSESTRHEVYSALKFLPLPHKRDINAPLALDPLIVFDVGANIGNYTREVLNQHPNCVIFAFEPSISSGSKFMENHITEMNVNFGAFGFSNEISSKTLYSDYPGSPISSLTKRNLEHFGNELKYQEKVKLETIDNFCAVNRIIPNLLKIDVEGHELDVLMGSLSVIDKVAIVQFEFGGCNIDTRTFFQDFWYFFKQHNFRIYRVTKNEPRLISQYVESCEYFSTTNYIAVNNRVPE
jgi:FkbM family methyltransferase